MFRFSALAVAPTVVANITRRVIREFRMPFYTAKSEVDRALLPSKR